MDAQEYSPSGDPIFKYENVKPKEFTVATGDLESIEAISKHIETQVGVIESVFHEIVSDQVHIDVYWVKPTEAMPYHSFITSGMSDKPMNAPVGCEAHRYAELCILLPQDWVSADANTATMEEAFEDETKYWPIRWLKIIARFPHEYDTWISRGHSIPNGENADPFADNTQLGCMVLMPSLSLGPDFFELKINEEKTIEFYCLYPIYKEEMDFKLKKGLDGLIDKFGEFGVDDVVDIERVNTCKKKGLFGLW